MQEPQDTEGRPDSAKGVTGDLASRIASAKRERQLEDNRASGGGSDNSGIARGLRLGSEFAAAILVGTGIGYVIDQGLKTSPWGLLIMLLVGFAAGVLNVIRAVAEMDKEAKASPASGAGSDAVTEKPDDF
ncbi:MAG TPA: AtpZ/AtpI family protein [Devosia sp.]|jgi:ATP synthase protein I|uniref:AtpZ/AtpI family protein n=1 Tax=Devosia sp. TaxID=1871048 RepID=UPI002F945EAC